MKPLLRRGQTAIGLLVSVFLLVGLAAFFLMPRGAKDDGTPQKSTLKRSMDMAEGVAADSNLNQIRMAISMFKSDNDGKPPASLDELKNSSYAKGITPEMWINPVDKKPFLYDPATGTICAQGPGCPPDAAPAVAAPAPAAPGVAPAPAAPSSPTSPEGPGGVRMKIPQPGAGAAEAMNDN
jgi:hypothetical protein